MELILQIIGGLIVTVVLLIVIGFYGFKFWLRYKLGKLGQALLQGDSGASAMVARISLHPNSAPEWSHPEEIEQLTLLLRHSGFKLIDDFSIPQMADMNLRALYHSKQTLVATIYDHPAMDLVFDIVAIYNDSSSLTVSSNLLHDPEDDSPNDVTISQAELTPKQALALIEQHDSGKPRRLINKTNFVSEFKQAYARKMDWKIKRGTISKEFVKMNADAMQGKEFSEDQLDLARWQSEADLAGLIEDACLDNFFRRSDLNIQDWDNLREVMFVIHERMTRDEIVDLLSEWLETETEAQLIDLSESLAELSGVKLFRAINKALPERQRMIEMGIVEEPVKACVCLAPA